MMLSALNHDILFSLHVLATSSTLTAGVVIFFAEWFPLLVLISIVVYEFLAVEKEEEVFRVLVRTALPSFIVWIVVMSVKLLFPSPRPFVEMEITPLISVADPFGSFPSAHAAVFGALAGTIFVNHFHVWKWYLISAILISLARVAAGVHWPADVASGILFGLLFGFIIAKLLSRKKK